MVYLVKFENPQFWTQLLLWCRLQNLKVDLLLDRPRGLGIHTLSKLRSLGPIWALSGPWLNIGSSRTID